MTDATPLVLRVSWERDGKLLDGFTEYWYPVGPGRFICGYCGDKMTGKALREHFWKCAVQEGMLPP